MSTIIVSLSDIIIDPKNKIDLTALSIDEACKLIKRSYRFISSLVEVKIENGYAIINFREEEESKIKRAVEIYQEGVKKGERGNYKKAIELFKKVLDVIPEHIDARRNLGMAYLELGDIEGAKDNLIDVLRIDPKDTWSYVLLGNIYGKYEKERDFESQERFYMKAYELNPFDSYLLNNLAALRTQQNNYKDAQRLFHEALSINPKYPNSYFGLAYSYFEEKRYEMALVTLEDLFVKSSNEDPRSIPVFKEARELYLRINQKIVEQKYEMMMSFIDGHREEIEVSGNIPIQVLEDDTLKYITARTQMSWKHKREHHEIRYRKTYAEVLPHILCHELEHIVLETEARKVQRNKIFISTPLNRETAIRSVSDQIYRLKEAGYTEEVISTTMNELIQGLINQLFNFPIDMLIEKRIYDHYDVLRPSQFVSLFKFQDEHLSILKNNEIKKLTPRLIYQSNITLNCAYALCLDFIYGQRTDYAKHYRDSGSYQVGLKLFNLWKDFILNFKHGDEYDLVEAFGNELRLQNWYSLKPDDTLEEAPQGPTNPQLLKKKEPATVMYCLGALERYEDMAEEKIKEIAFEVGLLGQNGIDYTNADKRYSLRSIPDEQFTGLQLLCLMYVGFQKIDPKLNTGLDFKDAYEIALKMYKPSK